MKKRSEKTENARSKRRHRKGGGQAATKKRSPLRRMWNRGRARSAKVHACGAQLKGEFQEISRECEGARSPKVHACGAQLNREFQEISRECEGGLKIKDARAGALEAPYGCWRSAAEKRKRPKSVKLFRQILQKIVIFQFFLMISAQILMKFCRNFADILKIVEIFRIFF